MSFQALTWACTQSDGLTAPSKFVLMMLANRAGNDDFSCYPSLASISKETLLTTRSVINQIKTLESLGYVKVERNHRQQNRYSLNLSRISQADCVNDIHSNNEFSVNDVHSTSERGSPKVVNDVHPKDSLGESGSPPSERGSPNRVNDVHTNLSVEPIREPVRVPPNPQTGVTGGFDAFWFAYPKKAAKEDARKAFSKLGPDDGLLATILSAIEAAKKSRDWTKDDGRYVPYAATWLNGKRWEDDYTSNSYSSSPAQKPEPAWMAGGI